MTRRALIGYSGLVGSNLLSQRAFEARYNSSNIQEIRGQSFDSVVCAGISAVKWWANQNPAEDRARIESLIAALSTVTADAFTLISTVDVYGRPVGVSEDDEPSREGLHPYGLNRLAMEEFVARRFATHRIVRLPALFGRGLKKNALFDLIHGNNLGVINPLHSFQWYPLLRLGDDLDVVRSSGLAVTNLATEPVTMATIRDRFFPGATIGSAAGSAMSYDMHTRHASLFGGSGPYVMTADAVLASMQAFLAAEGRP